MPEEFVELNLIRELHGAYTLETLEQVPAQKVLRWQILLSEEAKEQRAITQRGKKPHG